MGTERNSEIRAWARSELHGHLLGTERNSGIRAWARSELHGRLLRTERNSGIRAWGWGFRNRGLSLEVLGSTAKLRGRSSRVSGLGFRV